MQHFGKWWIYFKRWITVWVNHTSFPYRCVAVVNLCEHARTVHDDALLFCICTLHCCTSTSPHSACCPTHHMDPKSYFSCFHDLVRLSWVVQSLMCESSFGELNDVAGGVTSEVWVKCQQECGRKAEREYLIKVSIITWCALLVHIYLWYSSSLFCKVWKTLHCPEIECAMGELLFARYSLFFAFSATFSVFGRHVAKFNVPLYAFL